MFARLMQWRFRTWILLLVILTAVVYAGTVRNAFVNFDDPPLITENAAVHELTPRSLLYVFSSFDPELYIPLTLFSYQLEGAFFGLTPGVVHATNLLLHLMNVVLVGWVAWGLTRRTWVAVLIAGIFALHPINAQAVLWASARKDLLSALFSLTSFGLYVVYRRNGGRTAYLLSLALFLCALLSKVSVALFPLMLLLTDWLEGDRLRTRIREKIPFFVISALLIIVAFIGKSQILESSDLRTNILLGFKSIVFYLWRAFVPIGFSIIHPQIPLYLTSAFLFLFYAGMTVLLLLIALLAAQRWRILTWGIAFFLLFLIPTFTNFFQNGELYFAYERYAYLPLVGILLSFFAVLDMVFQERERLRMPFTVALALCVLTLGALAMRQVSFWRSSEALFRHVLILYPNSAVAHGNLGSALVEQGDLDGALREYQLAQEADPEFVFALFNTSQVLWRQARYDLSDRFLEGAMQIVRKKNVVVLPDLLPFFTYAERQRSIGKGEEAIHALEEAAELAPHIAVAHYNLGVQYHAYGRLDDALRELERSRSLQPRNADMQYHLASLYAERGQLQEAKDALETVLWLNPSYPKAEEHLRNIQRLLAQ